MKSNDQRLLEEAYETVCEDASPLMVFLPLFTIIGSLLGTSIAQLVSGYNEDPRTFKEKVKGWFADRTLKKIAQRLKDDPEVIDFVKNPRKKGWQNMISSKLSADELQYLKRLNRSYFTWRK